MSIYRKLPVNMNGHVKAYYQDEPNVLILDKDNAIHPQNMARIIARALSNEYNYYIHRIAFGNGGTVVDAAYNITYNPPNTGLPGDLAEWRSQLYNEIYSEIVDDSNMYITYGSGATPDNDPASAPHDPSGPGVVSRELGIISEVVIKCVLNEDEPVSQFDNDTIGVPGQTTEQTEAAFVFDEIGLFTTGLPLSATNGYQFVNVGTRTSSNECGLIPNTMYTFSIYVNNAIQHVTFTTPSVGSGSAGQILYSDLITQLNSVLVGCQVSLNNGTDVPNLTNPVDINTLTYGYLKFTSNTTGSTSSINIQNIFYVKAASTANINISSGIPTMSLDGTTLQAGDLILIKNQTNLTQNGVYTIQAGGTLVNANYVASMGRISVVSGTTNGQTLWSIATAGANITFNKLNAKWLFDVLDNFVEFLTPVPGYNAGVQNNPNNPATEASRMLTHLIFSPIHKTKNRTLIIEYILTVTVGNTE